MRTKEEGTRYVELQYKKHYKPLYLYALTFLGDEEEAKDTVNDVFETVWRKWLDGDYEQELPTYYFYRSVRSHCLDALRHRRVEDRYTLMMATADIGQSDDDVRDYEQRIVRLHEAIQQLPEPGQSVLRCCYFKNLTYQETARQLGLTVNVVHKNMIKMFRILREMLKSEDGRH